MGSLMEANPFTAFDIQDDVSRIETVFATNILSPENSRHPLLRAAFTEIMIFLNDLLQKAKDFNIRITFNEDMTLIGKVNDITDTVNTIRNAVCHIPSKTHLFDDTNNIRATFNVAYGYQLNFMSINGVKIGSDYSDDVCFWFGKFKIYIYRHIHRAKEEAKISFTLLIVFSAFPLFVALDIPELAPLCFLLAIQYNTYQ